MDPTSGSGARQSLIAGDGVGTMLGLAIGDVAVHRHGYSSRTQIAIALAYHLMEHGMVERKRLIEALLELGRPGESVFTDPSPALTAWLEGAAEGRALATAEPTSEIATRAVPLGVWFREDADALVAAVIEVGMLENIDAQTLVTAVAAGGAVAAATLAMSGWDLVLAAAETAERVLPALANRDVTNLQAATAVPEALSQARSMVGRSFHDAMSVMTDVAEPLRPILAAIVAGGDSEAAPALVIESAGVNGGVDAAVLTGAILGARLGLRRWPWRAPNETWFSEIGRRLVGHEREIRDLPVPRAVEERVRRAEPIDPAREIG